MDNPGLIMKIIIYMHKRSNISSSARFKNFQLLVCDEPCIPVLNLEQILNLMRVPLKFIEIHYF